MGNNKNNNSDNKRGPISSFQKPSCLSLLLCDSVIEDKRTGKKSLIGLFNGIYMQKFPAKYPVMYLFISLYGGRGAVPVDIKISQLVDEKNIVRAKGNVTFKDPLTVCDMVIELKQIPFKTEGQYAVTIYCGDQPIAERRFTVKTPPQK